MTLVPIFWSFGKDVAGIKRRKLFKKKVCGLCTDVKVKWIKTRQRTEARWICSLCEWNSVGLDIQDMFSNACPFKGLVGKGLKGQPPHPMAFTYKCHSNGWSQKSTRGKTTARETQRPFKGHNMTTKRHKAHTKTHKNDKDTNKETQNNIKKTKQFQK